MYITTMIIRDFWEPFIISELFYPLLSIELTSKGKISPSLPS